MQLVRVAALFGAAVLGACSGGGSSGNGSGGTVVTPSPSPSGGGSPSPSPSPGPSYTKFADLTGDQSFASLCTSFGIGSPPTLYPATLPDNGFSFAYAASAQSWSVSGNGLALTFTPAERDMAAPATTIAYNKTTSSPVERLRISTVGVGSTPAEYLRMVILIANEPGAPGRNSSCVIGVKTLLTDVPAATTVTFPMARLGGYLFRTAPGSAGNTQLGTNNSTVALDVNLATGDVRLVIRLIGTPLPTGSGPDIDLGTFTANAEIDPATGGWYGTDFTSADMEPRFAQVSGRFYGPQGKESGFAMTLFAQKPDGSILSLSGTGLALR